MKTQMWTWAVCISIAVTSHHQPACSQDAVASPIDPPSLNPIDPASLKDAPAFGVSGPVSKPQETPSTESKETPETVWIPKLRVVLVTAMSTPTALTVQVVPERATNDIRSPFESAGQIPSAQNTTRKIIATSRMPVILTCDAVNVEVVSSKEGKLTYGFSCNSHAVLSIDGYTVSGDSISANEGKLTITNAVIKSDQATMTSETMVLQLPILAVQVGAANASDSLKPVPDPISTDRQDKTRDVFTPDLQTSHTYATSDLVGSSRRSVTATFRKTRK